MQNRRQLMPSVFLILLGCGLLLAELLHINLWELCFPLLLIISGTLLVLRPRVFEVSPTSSWHLLGDIRRSGEWTVVDEELWLFLGDTQLDFTQARLPTGETRIHLNGFIGDIKLIMPADIGWLISASGLIVDMRTPTDKLDRFLAPVHVASPNYDTAERKVYLITTFLIGDIDVLQR